eukprot:Nk52_evm46s217 gene=Nk52_evmTU46s217
MSRRPGTVIFSAEEKATFKSQFDSFTSSDRESITGADVLHSAIKACGINVQKYEVDRLFRENATNSVINYYSFIKILSEIKYMKNTKGSAVSGHTPTNNIERSEIRNVMNYLNSNLNDENLSDYLPIEDEENFFDIVADGVVLGCLVNKCIEGTIPKSKIKTKNLNKFTIGENNQAVLEGIKKIGGVVVNVGVEDFINGNESIIMGLLQQIIRLTLLGRVNLNLAKVCSRKEFENVYEKNDFKEKNAEAILLKWFNYILKDFGIHIENFGDDVKDCHAYIHVLGTLFKESASIDIQQSLKLSHEDRSLIVTNVATKLGIVFIRPSHITEGNTNLNLAFAAQILNKYVQNLEAQERAEEDRRKSVEEAKRKAAQEEKKKAAEEEERKRVQDATEVKKVEEAEERSKSQHIDLDLHENKECEKQGIISGGNTEPSDRWENEILEIQKRESRKHQELSSITSEISIGVSSDIDEVTSDEAKAEIELSQENPKWPTQKKDEEATEQNGSIERKSSVLGNMLAAVTNVAKGTFSHEHIAMSSNASEAQNISFQQQNTHDNRNEGNLTLSALSGSPGRHHKKGASKGEGKVSEAVTSNAGLQVYNQVFGETGTELNKKELVSIKFQCECKSKKDEAVYIFGDIEELGNWDANRAIPMKTNPQQFPVWSKLIIVPRNTRVQYKYFIVKDSEEYQSRLYEPLKEVRVIEPRELSTNRRASSKYGKKGTSLKDHTTSPFPSRGSSQTQSSTRKPHHHTQMVL